jgi:hypothetical protein
VIPHGRPLPRGWAGEAGARIAPLDFVERARVGEGTLNQLLMQQSVRVADDAREVAGSRGTQRLFNLPVRLLLQISRILGPEHELHRQLVQPAVGLRAPSGIRLLALDQQLTTLPWRADGPALIERSAER